MKTRIPILIIVLLLSLLATIARADITSGLVLNLTMDDVSGSTAHDATANHLDATLVNMPTDNSEWVPGLISGGLQFDGTKVQYATNSGAALNAVITNKVFTLAVWVKASNLSSGSAILAKATPSGHESCVIDVNANHWRFFVRNASAVATQLNPTTPTTNGNWTHLVAVFSQPSGIMQMYINGTLAATTTPPATLWTDAHEMSVGNRQSGTAYNMPPFGGLIDDVRVYSRALSASDITELYAYGNHAWSPVAFSSTPLGGSRYVGDVFAFSAQTVYATIPLFPLSPVFYQWYHINGANVTNLVNNATNSSLTLTNLQLADGGSYFLQASNLAGVTNSQSAVLTVSALPAANLTNGLVAYWAMDETSGSTAADSSGNGHAGTLNNFLSDDSQWTAGVLGNALNDNNFANPGEVVIVPDAPDLNFDTNSAAASAFSLSAWVQGSISPTGQTNGAAIICKGGAGGGESYAIDYYNNAFRFYVRPFGGGGATTIQPGILANGLWQHLVGVFDATNRIMWFYINGQLAGTATPPAAGVQWNNHEVSLGCRESSSGYNMPFWGHLDDVRIYNRALNSADVQALYLLAGVYPPSVAVQPQSASRYVEDRVTFSPTIGGTTPLTYKWLKNNTNVIAGATGPSLTLTNLQLSDAGSYSVQVSNAFGVALSSNAVLQVSVFNISNTVAYWKLNETSGLSAADSSGSGNTATLNNFPGNDLQWVVGRVAGGLTMNTDGSLSEVVTVPDSPAVNFYPGSAFTLAAWIRGALTGQQSATPAILCKGTGAGGEQYGIDIINGAFRFYVRNMNGEATSLQSTAALGRRWRHVVATYDIAVSSMNLYVDGQLAASATPANRGPMLPTTHELSIGSKESGAGSGYNLPFQGVIDDVRFYGRAISAADVQSLYAAAGPLAPCFYAQPQNASAYAGDGVTLSVVADGTAPLSYQWQKNGSSLAGATNASLMLTSLQLNDAGTYRVQLTDANTSLLSSNAVLQVLAAPAPDITNNLVAYWTFDETNGFAAGDSSGNGNSASLYGFPVDDSEWVAGVKGGALQFDSTGGNYLLTDAPLNGLANGNQFTFSFWAKQNPGAHGTNPRFICPLKDYSITTDQSWVVWTVGTGGVGFYPSAPSTQPSTTTWHHFVVEYDRLAATYTLYVDGAPQQFSIATHALADPTASPAQWVIGHSEDLGTSTDSWDGLLDDLRIYAGRLLNGNDVRALYYAVAQPRLTVAPNGSSIAISWPVAALGYRLQKSDVVSGGTWNNVTTNPSVSADGLTQTVSQGVEPTPGFYRLVNP